MGPNWLWLIHTNQRWASHDSINVDNLRDLLMIDVMVTFDNPHPSVGIRLITNMSEPTNKGTVIVLAMILECKEDADLSNTNAQHAPLVWVCLNEDGVVSESTFLPWWCSMNMFASHTLSHCVKTPSSQTLRGSANQGTLHHITFCDRMISYALD